MSENQYKNQNNVGIVAVNTTKREKDSKGRDRVALILRTPQKGPGAGVNQVTKLIELLEPFRGKEIKLDIRIEERKNNYGTFDAAFIMVNKLAVKGNVEYVSKGDLNGAKVQEG